MGIDVTRSALVLVLVNLELEILDLVKMHITFEDTEEYYETINVQLEQLLKRNQVDRIGCWEWEFPFPLLSVRSRM